MKTFLYPYTFGSLSLASPPSTTSDPRAMSFEVLSTSLPASINLALLHEANKAIVIITNKNKDKHTPLEK